MHPLINLHSLLLFMIMISHLFRVHDLLRLLFHTINIVMITIIIILFWITPKLEDYQRPTAHTAAGIDCYKFELDSPRSYSFCTFFYYLFRTFCFHNFLVPVRYYFVGPIFLPWRHFLKIVFFFPSKVVLFYVSFLQDVIPFVPDPFLSADPPTSRVKFHYFCRSFSK